MERLTATLLQTDPRHGALVTELERAGFVVARVEAAAAATAVRASVLLVIERALVTDEELAAIANAHPDVPLVALVDEDPPAAAARLIALGAADWLAPLSGSKLE